MSITRKLLSIIWRRPSITNWLQLIMQRVTMQRRLKQHTMPSAIIKRRFITSLRLPRPMPHMIQQGSSAFFATDD